MENDNAISVKNLHKSFKLPHEKQNSIKGLVLNIFNYRRSFENQHVLDDISLDIKKGEFFGIVGRNGSGKSTLLKLLAGIYAPDSGQVIVDGKLTPFIELGVGFNPDLTARENVYLNGALLGFDRKEVDAMYDEIVDFAELQKFMDQKLRNYSSGMQVRLAFSIAIRARSDILVLDEVLAVGDEAFQRKCYEYFAKLKSENKTVILVTHAMDSVTRFCDRAALIHKGKLKLVGATDKVTKLYEDLNMPQLVDPNANPDDIVIANDAVEVEVDPVKDTGKVTSTFSAGDKIGFDIKISSKQDISDYFLGFSIRKLSGELAFFTTTEVPGTELPSLKANKPLELSIDMQNIFSSDSYIVDVSVKSNDRSKIYGNRRAATNFKVVVNGRYANSYRPDYKLTIAKPKPAKKG